MKTTKYSDVRTRRERMERLCVLSIGLEHESEQSARTRQRRGCACELTLCLEVVMIVSF